MTKMAIKEKDTKELGVDCWSAAIVIERWQLIVEWVSMNK